ncbi:MAG: membrane protein insertase YidC [Bdellovibrionales bacterium]|nr:membrane protein insertase YidC [Bdellovibrionales bacterium]
MKKHLIINTIVMALVFSSFYVSNASSAELSLSGSTFSLGDGSLWIQGWKQRESSGIDLNTVSGLDGANLILTFSGDEFAYLNGMIKPEIRKLSDDRYEWVYQDANVELRRTYEVNGDSVLVAANAKFKSKPPTKAFLSFVGQGFGVVNTDQLKYHPEKSDREVLFYSENKLERKRVEKPQETTRVKGSPKWFGLGSRYFLFTVFPENTPVEEFFYEIVEGQGGGEPVVRGALQLPVNQAEVNARVRLAFVPKRLDALKRVDPTLDLSVDLGFFTIIAYPILKILLFIHKFVGNYGIAIIILTILIKILTFPLVVKSMKGMKKMAEFQPKMKALQEKHKNDKAALNLEMMALMKQSGYNPMAGCLPMLLQMPIFFALYQVLNSAQELYGAPFAFWIKDLSVQDPLYITPILMSVVMFLQQKLTPPSPGMDPAQRKMMMFMPLVFGIFMLGTPSGLCVYMLVNAVVSVIQQQYLNKKLGVPGNAASMATSF